MEFPRLLAASINSPASFSSIDFSPRAREYVRIQRMAKEVRRARITSTSTPETQPPNTPGFYFQDGLDVFDCFLEKLERVVLGLLLNHIHGVIEDVLGSALLSAVHHAVDELRDERALIHRVRQDLPLDDMRFSRHRKSLANLKLDNRSPTARFAQALGYAAASCLRVTKLSSIILLAASHHISSAIACGLRHRLRPASHE